jgi:tRNA modification GTPase
MGDTIVAPATPPGEGAISIIRVSGTRALAIGERVAPTRQPLESHRLVVVGLRSVSGELLDEGMKVEMHAPRSFTGEDVVELHVHGSRVVVDSVVQACLDSGARLAGPGEFSMRAFIHGRMDLSQAEAVADLIAARGRVQQLIATAQLRGGLSEQVGGLLDRLEKIRADWQAVLDFPEQLDETDLADHTGLLKEIVCRIKQLISAARVELSRGLRVVLCGATNVGKSTLLNSFVGHERVLVDEAPGTTRDPIEVEVEHGGVRWSMCDTAGLRVGDSGVEARGIAMSYEWIHMADLALWIVSPENPLWPPEEVDVEVVGGKADLAPLDKRRAVEEEGARRGLQVLGWVSGHTGDGVDLLRQRIAGRWDTASREGETVVVRQRHLDALRDALAALQRAQTSTSPDLRCMEVETASRQLGAIVGRDVDLGVLERIFNEFCIGK